MIECVARGYRARVGRITDDRLGVRHRVACGPARSERLPEPIFTPATKAQSGHDINISEADAAQLVGADVLARARELTLRLYAEGSAHAESCGIIVADTKFEFGLLPDDGRPAAERLILIDEALTPDSSRFWRRTASARAARNPASTSSSCATIRSHQVEQTAALRRRCQTTSSRRHATSMSRRFAA